MHFRDIDFEECNIMVFDGYVSNGSFSGNVYGIKEYIRRFSDAEFEILTEKYGGYNTVFQGQIWRKGTEPVLDIINIWTMGDITFILDH